MGLLRIGLILGVGIWLGIRTQSPEATPETAAVQAICGAPTLPEGGLGTCIAGRIGAGAGIEEMRDLLAPFEIRMSTWEVPGGEALRTRVSAPSEVFGDNPVMVIVEHARDGVVSSVRSLR